MRLVPSEVFDMFRQGTAHRVAIARLGGTVHWKQRVEPNRTSPELLDTHCILTLHDGRTIHDNFPTRPWDCQRNCAVSFLRCAARSPRVENFAITVD